MQHQLEILFFPNNSSKSFAKITRKILSTTSKMQKKRGKGLQFKKQTKAAHVISFQSNKNLKKKSIAVSKWANIGCLLTV